MMHSMHSTTYKHYETYIDNGILHCNLITSTFDTQNHADTHAYSRNRTLIMVAQSLRLAYARRYLTRRQSGAQARKSQARSRLQVVHHQAEAFCEALHVSTYTYMYTERVTAAKGDTMARSNHSPLNGW
jgi:hypothetical protein